MNLIAATLAALVVREFQATVEQVIALAALMTVVASMGGNAADPDADGDRAGHRPRRADLGATRGACSGKEALVGVANGIVLGAAGAQAWPGGVFGNPVPWAPSWPWRW